jgi:hypothetical protein
MKQLNQHGHAVLNRVRLKFGLSINCPVADVMAAYLAYDEKRIELLDKDEDRLMVFLLAEMIEG